VLILTRGACEPSVRYGVHIADGMLINGGGMAKVQGRVTRSGTVSVIARTGSQWANGSGRLGRNRGYGARRGDGRAATAAALGWRNGESKTGILPPPPLRHRGRLRCPMTQPSSASRRSSSDPQGTMRLLPTLNPLEEAMTGWRRRRNGARRAGGRSDPCRNPFRWGLFRKPRTQSKPAARRIGRYLTTHIRQGRFSKVRLWVSSASRCVFGTRSTYWL
jgi:hypothetical protein